jgi:PilZ domain
MPERRRTRRVSLRIPIFVEGIDKSGNRFREQTATIEISREGARIGLRNTLRLGAEVHITNLLTSATALFRTAVQCPQSYGGLPEWGVVLSSPLSGLVPEFWGVAFEDWAEQREPELDVSALLLCRKCGRREMVGLTQLEYHVLRSRMVLPRVCPACRAATDWQAASLEQPRFPATLPPLPDSQGSAPWEEQEAETEVQRRGARRVAVHVPLLIHAAGERTERTTSRNVSKTGLSFATALDLDAGEEIEILVGYGVTKSPAIQTARVVWRQPETKGVRALIGVQFTGTKPGRAPEKSEAAEGRRKRRKQRQADRRREPT